MHVCFRGFSFTNIVLINFSPLRTLAISAGWLISCGVRRWREKVRLRQEILWLRRRKGEHGVGRS